MAREAIKLIKSICIIWNKIYPRPSKVWTEVVRAGSKDGGRLQCTARRDSTCFPVLFSKLYIECTDCLLFVFLRVLINIQLCQNKSFGF